MVFFNQNRKFRIFNFEAIGSTQDQALRLYNESGNGNFIVTSNSMTEGRGRHGNIWLMGANNLAFSMLLSDQLENIDGYHLPFVVSIALYEVLELLIKRNIDISIKWPNDILLEGKKVAGILIETSINPRSRKFNYVNIGIGVNISTIPGLLDREITSISAYSELEIENNLIVEPLKAKILFWLDFVLIKGFDALKQKWMNYSKSVGSAITTTSDGIKITGIFDSLGAMGEMILRLPDGTKKTITTGIVE